MALIIGSIQIIVDESTKDIFFDESIYANFGLERATANVIIKNSRHINNRASTNDVFFLAVKRRFVPGKKKRKFVRRLGGASVSTIVDGTRRKE